MTDSNPEPRLPDDSGSTPPGQTRGSGPTRLTARQINDQIRYTGWSVYSRRSDPDVPSQEARDELAWATAQLDAQGVTVRGFYDVSALRADADLMIWWHAPTAEALQDAARRLRRTAIGRILAPVWSAMGLHRPAEFNKGHVPAFLTGAPVRNWVAVYPFVRSYEWYLLPDAERRAMLVEHGVMGREHNQVLSNTVAAFAMSDWEWLLALEATELHDIVDLMRRLRSSQARLHVRQEIPFFTGRLIDVHDVVEVLR